MAKIAIAIHGGASEITPFIYNNLSLYESALYDATAEAYKILKKGGNALDAVEKAVIILEDNPLFNAGKGSALNNQGKVEMDASIMNGKTLEAGAVSIVQLVKNPIILARLVMTKTPHVLLSGYGALAFAKSENLILKPQSYFITDNQHQDFLHFTQKKHGTVGAVALDKQGNLAAATSTGGTNHSMSGRIGDSCIIGAGCYANNKTCAVSGTGIGENLIKGVIAHSISMFIELKKFTLQKACDHVIQVRNKQTDIGVISVNQQGEIAISFNTEIMKRAWTTSDMKDIEVKIYR